MRKIIWCEDKASEYRKCIINVAKENNNNGINNEKPVRIEVRAIHERNVRCVRIILLPFFMNQWICKNISITSRV